MNKEILRLLELIEIINKESGIKEQFKALAEQFDKDESVTLQQLIESIEDEMSYWEE